MDVCASVSANHRSLNKNTRDVGEDMFMDAGAFYRQMKRCGGRGKAGMSMGVSVASPPGSFKESRAKIHADKRVTGERCQARVCQMKDASLRGSAAAAASKEARNAAQEATSLPRALPLTEAAR